MRIYVRRTVRVCSSHVAMPPAARTPHDNPPPGRRLPHGPHSLSRERVATDQRQRLTMALIAAIGERGYTATTVADIVARAGVSRKTFYQHFAGKQECFLTAYDAITIEGMHRVQHAYYAVDGWADRVEAAIRVLFESAIENPDAVRLIMVEIGAVGSGGIEHREHVMAQYTQFMRDGLDLPPGKGTGPDITLGVV